MLHDVAFLAPGEKRSCSALLRCFHSIRAHSRWAGQVEFTFASSAIGIAKVPRGLADLDPFSRVQGNNSGCPASQAKALADKKVTADQYKHSQHGVYFKG